MVRMIGGVDNFKPFGRHQLEFTVIDDIVTVKADVDFDKEIVISWEACDWNGIEALRSYNMDDIYHLCFNHALNKWRAEQRLIKLILTEGDDVI